MDEHLEARQSVLLIQGNHVQQTGQSEHVDHSRNGTSKSAIISQMKSIKPKIKLNLPRNCANFRQENGKEHAQRKHQNIESANGSF